LIIHFYFARFKGVAFKKLQNITLFFIMFPLFYLVKMNISGRTNYCSSNDDFERMVKTIILVLANHRKDAITNFLITAKGNLNGEYINLQWNNLNDFCEFLQNEGLINNRALQLQ